MAHILRDQDPTPPPARHTTVIGAESAGSTPPGGLACLWSVVMRTQCCHRRGQVALATLVRERSRSLACVTLHRSLPLTPRVHPTTRSADLAHCSSLLTLLARNAAVGAAARDASRSDRDRALPAGARVALARADSAAARARVAHGARLPEPVAGGELLEVDAAEATSRSRFRSTRRGCAARASARRAHRSARRGCSFLSERAAAVVEVDTTYTQALAAEARFRLSRQTRARPTVCAR